MAEPEIAVLLRTCKHADINYTSRNSKHLPSKFGYALKCDNVAVSYAKTPIQVPIPQQSPQLIDIGVYRPSVSLSGIVETQGRSVPTSYAKTFAAPVTDATEGAEVGTTYNNITNLAVGMIGISNGEQFEITAISDPTVTVRRGANKTTTVAHASGDAVTFYEGPAFFEGLQSISYTRTAGYGSATGSRTYYVPYKNQLENLVTDYVYSSKTPLEVEWGDASYPLGPINTGGSIYLCALQQARFQVDATKEDRYTFSMQLVVTSRKDFVKTVT